MAQQHLNTGSVASDGTGDTLRGAFIKTEENFIDLYDVRGPSLPDYTGSLIMTSSEGQTSPLLQLTGSFSTSLTSSVPTFNLGFNTSLASTEERYIRRIQEEDLSPNVSFPHLLFQRTTSGYYNRLYLSPNSNGQRMLFLKFAGTNRVEIGQSSYIMNLKVKNQNSNTLLLASSQNLSILTDSTFYTLNVEGDIQASEYFFFQSPTPGSGDFQSKSSDTIFGDGGSIQILCQV